MTERSSEADPFSFLSPLLASAVWSRRMQSMMMIASTKLAKAQRAMNAAKVYGEANNGEWC